MAVAFAPSSSDAAQTGGGRRPRWLTEFVILGVLYLAYEASRFALRSHESIAMANGHAILSWEVRWNLDYEYVLNGLLELTPLLAVVACYCYAVLHYVVTPCVLIWLYRKRPAFYPHARTVLALGTALAVLGYYLMPTAPPRLLAGAHIGDVLSQYSSFGWWDTAGSVPRGMSGLANQYAAMPSLHVGWALWCGVMLVVCARRWWVRALGGFYPIVIALVVMGTGNHYLLDVVAGVVVMGAGWGVTGMITRLGSAKPLRDGLPRGGNRRPRQVEQGVFEHLR